MEYVRKYVSPVIATGYSPARKVLIVSPSIVKLDTLALKSVIFPLLEYLFMYLRVSPVIQNWLWYSNFTSL
jgi:hypothetical protein